jgi:phospholipase C
MNFLSAASAIILLSVTSPSFAESVSTGLDKIEHIVVIYLENRSFDSLFGLFPGADGLGNAAKAPLQVNEYGKPYKTLPPILSDNKFPDDLPNKPFDIGRFVPLDQKHPDLTHRFFINQMQINAGRNDKFVQLSSAGALSLGHYDLSQTAMWRYAKQYTLADHFFQGAFGGSFLNHQWLICACTPEFKNASPSFRHWINDVDTGKPVQDPIVTADGYAVNTIQPHFPPFDPSHDQDNENNRLPALYQPTIGDRLTEKAISWAWYAGDWNLAVDGRGAEVNFQYHHQPFVFYANYAPGAQARADHLKDRLDLIDALSGKASLPQVVFYKPASADDEHPGYSDILAADKDVAEIVEAIRNNSEIWKSSAIIITYDEYGGFWDHVAPPEIDRWGPGSRVPAIIISPYAKKGYIDHTVYDTTSILKLIESRFNLQPLTARDAQAANLLNAFNFKQK